MKSVPDFYIWGDDHIRSLLRCRHAIIYRRWDHQGGRMFHNNFWPNLELDPNTGQFVEHDNLLPTRESLYRMTSGDWMVSHLRDDWALQLFAFQLGYIDKLDREPISQLATRLDCKLDWDAPDTLRVQAGRLLDRYSLQATQYVLGKTREFAQQQNKKLLVVLLDPHRVMGARHRGEPRFDQEIVDFLVAEQFHYFDMHEVHIRDFENDKLPYEQYLKQYFIGHYNPRGNHFFAFALKDKIVPWLEPKPVTYRNVDPPSIDFRGYLPAGG